jgi:ubiquinone/menaquinone biosynthesis C-methylase UbiE
MKIINELLQYNRTKLIINTYSGWLAEKSKVLDIGCGDGVLTSGLTDKFRLKITGCDVINILQKPMAFALMQKTDKIPFPDKSFDSVMFNDVLHHASKKVQISLLKEAIRVSKKTILIMENLPSVRTYVFDYLINKLSHPQMDVPLAFRNKAEWLEIFSSLPVLTECKENLNSVFSLFPRIAFRLLKNK